nr:hypothetical protein [Tanacetum cinerariifolium]
MISTVDFKSKILPPMGIEGIAKVARGWFLGCDMSLDCRRVLDGAFGGVGDEEVVVGEGVVMTSSSLEMLTNSYLGGIKISLIFLKGLEEEALVEFMVELFEEDDKKSKKYCLFN